MAGLRQEGGRPSDRTGGGGGQGGAQRSQESGAQPARRPAEGAEVRVLLPTVQAELLQDLFRLDDGFPGNTHSGLTPMHSPETQKT